MFRTYAYMKNRSTTPRLLINTALGEPTTGKVSLCTGFKPSLLFPTFFFICCYFSLLFHENALLSLLFHSKMSLMGKNPDFVPRLLCSLRFYVYAGATPLIFLSFNFNPKCLSVQLVHLSQVFSCSLSVKFFILNNSL